MSVVGGAFDTLTGVEERFEVVTAPSHPKAKKLLDFWNQRADDGIVIGRDLPSRAMSEILSSISLNEMIDDGTDCWVRLSGNQWDTRFGGNTARKRLSELFPPEHFQAHLRTMHATIESGQPTIIHSRLTEGPIERLHMEIIHLPVIAPDRTTKWSLVAVFYFSANHLND